MKRGIFYFLILFLFLFLFPCTIKADTTSCAKVISTYNDYKEFEQALADNKCVDIFNTSSTCISLSMKKTYSLEKLFSYKKNNSDCITGEIESVLETNEENCTTILDSSFKDTVNYIMSIFYVVAPFLLIIFGSMDFFKILVASESSMGKDAPKMRRNLIKRVVAFVLLYMSPALVYIIINTFNGSGYELSGLGYTCRNISVYIPSSNIDSITIQYDTKGDVKTIGKLNPSDSSSSQSSTGQTGYSSSPTSFSNEAHNNGLFQMRMDNDRVTRDSVPKYYTTKSSADKVSFQCVWYARSRAQEIIDSVNIFTTEEKEKRMKLINSGYGNAWRWYSLSQGNGVLNMFQSSSNYKDARAGSIIVWSGGKVNCSDGPGGKCGHVGIVEDYNPETNKIRISEAGYGGGTWSSYWFRSQEWNLEDGTLNYGKGKYKFLGYIYLLEPLKE